MLAAGGFGTDQGGFKPMLGLGRRHPERTWDGGGRDSHEMSKATSRATCSVRTYNSGSSPAVPCGSYEGLWVDSRGSVDGWVADVDLEVEVVAGGVAR